MPMVCTTMSMTIWPAFMPTTSRALLIRARKPMTTARIRINSALKVISATTARITETMALTQFSTVTKATNFSLSPVSRNTTQDALMMPR